MTKIKKSLALMMVLVMAMTILAMPASATTVEEAAIEPRYVAVTCTSCGGEAVFVRRVTNERYGSVPVAEGICQHEKGDHSHYKVRDYDTYTCKSCGYTLKLNYSYSTVCPYA